MAGLAPARPRWCQAGSGGDSLAHWLGVNRFQASQAMSGIDRISTAAKKM